MPSRKSGSKTVMFVPSFVAQISNWDENNHPFQRFAICVKFVNGNSFACIQL